MNPQIHDKVQELAQYLTQQQLTLADARRLLEARAVRGLQLRYRYDNADWWDTLMVLPDGFRLVRLGHEFGAA